MKKIGIFFGSTTGTCEAVAGKLAEQLSVDSADVKSAADFDESVSEYEVLILGTSTWGDGELQDDWFSAVDVLKSLDLSGKTVAVFGCGDAMGYPDSFCSAMKPLYDAAVAAGATVLEGPSADAYQFGSSEAVVDGKFVGFPLDEMNEPDLTDERLAPMVSAIQSL